MNPVIMHVNYGEVSFDSFGRNTVDDICRMAAELGFDGIEFRSAPPKEFKEMPFEDFMDQIAKGVKEYGIRMPLFSIGLAQSAVEDKELRDAEVEKVLAQTRKIHDMFGTTLFNTCGTAIKSTDPAVPATAMECHGSAVATQEQWDRTVETYQKLAKGLEPMGIKFAFETHMKYIHDTPAAAKKLVDLIDSPSIGINMDYGNTVYFPGVPSVEEAIDIYGDKLFYTHLKNSVAKPGGGRTPIALCHGEINHRRYLKKLKDVGFDGPIGIEGNRPGDRYWYAQEDLAYYKAVRASIETM